MFAFLPPLIYTGLQEKFGDPRLSILALIPFFVVGLGFLLMLDMDKAEREIASVLHLRHGSSKFPAPDKEPTAGASA